MARKARKKSKPEKRNSDAILATPSSLAESSITVGSTNTLRLRNHLFIGAVLVILVSIAFAGVVRCDFVNFDDNVYVYDNESVKKGLSRDNIVWAFANQYRSNWHPVTWLSHMIDCSLYQLNPVGHHLTNLILHILNVLLLFTVLIKMTDDTGKSLFVAALFGVHPLHVESVAWVAERKDVLSTFFMLITLLFYVFYVEKPNVFKYIAMASAYALGLMSKPMLVTLPCVLLLLDYWPLNRYDLVNDSKNSAQQVRYNSRDFSGFFQKFIRMVTEKLPLFALAAALCITTVIYQKGGGAMATTTSYPLSQRIGNAILTYVIYIKQTVFPSGLAVFYPHLRDTIPNWQVAIAALLLIIITIGIVVNLRKRPYMAIGWLWYLGTLVPVIGLVQVGEQAHADRYTYIPHIGLFILMTWGFADLPRVRRLKTRTIYAGYTVIILVFTICTIRQVGFWRNNVTLWERALAVTENNAVAHNNLGKVIETENLDEAIKHFAAAVAIKPWSPGGRNNLAAGLFLKGQVDEAIEHFTISLQQKSKQEKIRNYLAVALNAKGKTDEAISHYHKTLKINPDNVIAHHNLGLIYSRRKQYDKAIEHFRQSIAVKPDQIDAHYSLGLSYYQIGEYSNAIQSFREVIKLNDRFSNVLYYLGVCYFQAGQYDKAATALTQATSVDPNNPEIHNLLGESLIKQGNVTGAVGHFEDAIRIQPNHPVAKQNLKQALSQKNN